MKIKNILIVLFALATGLSAQAQNGAGGNNTKVTTNNGKQSSHNNVNYYVNRNYKRTLENTIAEAKKGNLHAITYLGQSYMWGSKNNSFVQEDYNKALKYYRIAASQNYPFAMRELARMYHLGWGVNADKAKCIEWEDKAFQYYKTYADNGDVEAMNELANYYSGIYSDRKYVDDKASLYWNARVLSLSDSNYMAEQEAANSIYRKLRFDFKYPRKIQLAYHARAMIAVKKINNSFSYYSRFYYYDTLVGAGYKTEDQWKKLAQRTYIPVPKKHTSDIEGIHKSADDYLRNLKANANGLQNSGNSTSVAIAQANNKNPSAEIKKIGIETGSKTDQSETPNVVLHSNITIHNALGRRCLIVAYFYHKNGNKLLDYNNSYRTTDGQVCCTKEVTPIYENTSYANMQLSIPVSELHLATKTTYNLRCEIQVFDISGPSSKLISNSSYVDFALSTYGDKIIYGKMLECSSFAFGLRVGNCCFLDETGSSAYGYRTFNFGYEKGVYHVVVGYKDYYTYLREDDKNYIFQMAERKVKTEATEWYSTGYLKVPTKYETKVSFVPKPNPPLLYVAKDGSRIVIENALSNGGNAVLTKEITYNEALEIDKSRGSVNTNTFNPIQTNTYNNNSSNYQSTNSSSSSSNSSRRICPTCNGTGKGWDEIVYGTCYTGDCNEWCSTCGKIMSPHRHINHPCGTCHGYKYVDF